MSPSIDRDWETISAGRYLCHQYYHLGYGGVFDSPTIGGGTGYVSGEGLAAGRYIVYAAPILDGYQHGFPVAIGSYQNTAADGFLTILFSTSTGADYPRLTGFHLFVAKVKEYNPSKPIDVVVANYLETVDMDSDGEQVLRVTNGDVNNTTANKIVIGSYSNFLSFDPTNMFIENQTAGEYYRITNLAIDTPVAGQIELTVTPNPTDSGTNRTLNFFSRWYSSAGYQTVYDGHYKTLGAEMYDYLGIPKGDLGTKISPPSSPSGIAFHKYSDYNGNFYLIGGLKDDKNYTYYSKAKQPDIIPALNIFRHKGNVTGIAGVGLSDFLVFTDRGVERVAIYGNESIDQNDEYLDAILTNHKSIVKVSDNEVGFMTYKGAYYVRDRQAVHVGRDMREWFSGKNAKLTKAQKEGCVGGYNDEYGEMWFSFPDYTTSPFTTGVIMVFDVNAFRDEGLQAWWFVKTDFAVKAFTLNQQYHLLGGGTTNIVDFDGDGSETVDTSYKIKMLKGIIPGRQVRYGWLHVDAETNDSISVNLYFDGSASAVSLTLNSDLKGLIGYLKKTLEIEITTPASTSTVEHLGMVLEFDPMVVK